MAPDGIEAVVPYRSRAELSAQLDDIRAAPGGEGTLDLIVVRPAPGARATPDDVRLSAEGGVAGDHWSGGCWLSTEDGRPHPDVQVCIMSARVIRAIAGDPLNWPPAGDNLFLDMDLSVENLPAGTRLSVGEAVLEITGEPHKGCAAFAARYGREACAFVNTGEAARTLRLRGVYARVITDGTVSVGDRVRKLD